MKSNKSRYTKKESIMKTFKELAIRETLDEMQINHTNLLDNLLD